MFWSSHLVPAIKYTQSNVLTMVGPIVGHSSEYRMESEYRVPWVLGSRLHPDVGPLGCAPGDSRVFIESHEFARP